MSEWLSKKYLDNNWYELFEKNKGKKIICFGAGTALYTIPGLLPKGVVIDYYIDSKYQNWQENLQHMKVRPPETVKEEKKGSFFVLIGGQHTVSMRKQLLQYGLTENEDFFDFYGQYERVLRLAKVDYQTEQMIKFIQQIPKNELCREKLEVINEYEEDRKHNKKYGVVLTYTFLAPQMFDIAIYLLLRYMGYNAELIIDDILSIENLSVYDGITEDIKILDEKVIGVVKERFNCTVKYLSTYEKESLDELDELLVKEAAHANAVWQRSRNIDRSLQFSEEEWYQKFLNVLENNLAYIKAFFENNQYDAVTIFSGLHGQRFFYPRIAEGKGIRTATYDSAGSFSKWSSDGPCSHYYDIPYTIFNRLFSEKEREKIYKNAKENFNNRLNAVTIDGNGYTYQLAKNGKITDNWFDVIIPLNNMWDAAALGRNKLFNNEKQWLIETIDYILGDTNANILIREHPYPAGKKPVFYNTDSFKSIVEAHYYGNNRVFFADTDHVLNTYEYIKQCKVVLPFTSTVGIEAALLEKRVILHTNVYYDKLGFAEIAESKQEYFYKIKEGIEKENFYPKNLDNAWMAYLLIMNVGRKCIFNETTVDWMNMTLKEISGEKFVREIIQSITEHIPTCYSILKEKL